MRKPRNHVGRCIYCDSTEDLKREHIIPEGLGGRQSPVGEHEAMVLGKASCPKCQKITRDIEGLVMGKMMGVYREQKGFVRADRKQPVRRMAITHRDGESEYRDIPVAAVPGALALPAFGKPGVLSGEPIGGPYTIQIWQHIDNRHLTPAQVAQAKGITIAGLGPDIYAQFLAKVALGYAVREYGVDGFKPLVRDLIKGKKEEFGHWIGGPLLKPPEPPTDFLHEIGIGRIAEAPNYVVVNLRLFAILGAPRSYVIVGEDHSSRS